MSYRYEDFGETTSVGENTSGNETCYTGGRYDETTGLYYLNARYYNPEDGRFLSEDTYRGEVNQPDTQHLYVYCKDNPINYVDPSGHKYSPSKAANYAYKWGMKFNPQYANHTGQGDCTNFVSQCVHAGGKSMKKPLFLFHRRRISRTTSYWYSIKRQEYHGNYGPPTYWKESSSWTAVKDFYTYWKKHGAKIIFCSSKKILQRKAKKGDVVQLRERKNGWHHSIIISRGSKGKWKYAGHSNKHKAKSINSIKNQNGYRIIRIR
nr:amidase domain-containing protein [uncultured Anaerostipes sp.]